MRSKLKKKGRKRNKGKRGKRKMDANSITKWAEDVFNGLILDLLGPEFVSHMYIFKLKDSGESYDPTTTLDHQFLESALINNPITDQLETHLDDPALLAVKESAFQTISTLKQKAINDMTRAIADAKLELTAKIKQDPSYSPSLDDLFNIAKPKLDDIQQKIEKAVETIVDNELHVAQNYGAYSGIIEAAQAIGISDPTVFKIGVLDSKRCHHCWRLWTLPDKITPKVYKLSELSATISDTKNPEPSIAPTHPRCRDVLVTLMPGFGFDSSGRIIYKGIDPHTNQLWDEYQHQRSKI